MLAIHEISHGMGFGAAHPMANKIFSILANLPLGIPMSISFKKYHLEHHRYQGDEILDTDVPTYAEVLLFTNSARKLIWCILQPFFYTMRPLFVHPKPVEQMELVNIIVQLVFDLIVIKTLGWHILAYMIGGSILAMGLHPVAGHFISEHTLMFDNKTAKVGDNNEQINGMENHTAKINGHSDKLVNGDANNNSSRGGANGKQEEEMCRTVDDYGNFLVPETCSYYGPLNYLTFNVGYHVEHHDFPSIPGSRLHLLQEIAPEFYKNLNYHTSWTYVLYKYITDPNVGPFARVRRHHSYRKEKLV